MKVSLSLSKRPRAVYMNTEYVMESIKWLTRSLTSSLLGARLMAVWNTTVKAYRGRSSRGVL